MIDFLILAIVAIATVPTVVYLIRRRQRGEGCLGCPDSKRCNGNCSCGKKSSY